MNARIMPARSAKSENIIDLDEVLSQTVAIKVLGKTYEMVSITVEKAMEIDRAKGRMTEFLNRIEKEQVGMDEVYEEYFHFIHMVAPDVTLDDVMDMTVVQLNRFFKIANEHITLELTGKTLAENEQEKKKESPDFRLIPFIAFVCRFYGWQYESVMKMRMRTFWSFYNEANKLQAKEYLELLRIARIEYDYMEQHYFGIMDSEKKKLPSLPAKPGLDLASTDTKNHIIEFFASKRRGPRGRRK